jgi:hypothetical protein
MPPPARKLEPKLNNPEFIAAVFAFSAFNSAILLASEVAYAPV